MNKEGENNAGKLRFFQRIEEYNQESTRLAARYKEAESWIIPQHQVEKQCLQPDDLLARYAKTVLTLGIGPAIAKLREKKIEELQRQNGIRYLKASFVYLLQQPVPKNDPEKIARYQKALERLLEMAISYEHMPIISRLITRFDVVPNGKHLFIALIANSEKILNYLVEHGADPNCLGKRQTLLQVGLLRGPTKAKSVVEAMLNKNIDVTIPDNRGKTALHYAVPYFSVDIIAKIIDKGADVNAKTQNGDTPLHYATLIDIKNMATLDFLLSQHANPNAKDHRGRTPIAELVSNNSFPGKHPLKFPH